MPHDHLVKEAIIIGIKDKLKECHQQLHAITDKQNQLLRERKHILVRMEKLEDFRKDI